MGAAVPSSTAWTTRRLRRSEPRHRATVPKRRAIDLAAVDDLIRLRERVVTHAELVALGVPLSTVCARIRRHGPWQRLHPGVVLAHTGRPTRREQLLGALAYAGPGAVLTGVAALRVHGMSAARLPEAPVHVLIAHASRRQSRRGLVVERSRHLPGAVEVRGLPLAPAPRCVVDACRELSDIAVVRELVSEAVQSGLCSIDELREALAAAARQRSALPREVLAEVGAGVRSAAEGRARAALDRAGIRQPLWNWSLHTLDGDHVVTPDGWWEHIGCALQIDSMRWHLSAGRYRRTQHLQRLMSTYGVPFLPIAPGDVFADEAGFVRQVREFLEANAEHEPSPRLVARPPVSARR